ncbi:G-protein beta WD-40 repeat [Phytophthora cactorum]|nr:G-protein beta WD-40 repeat [Phytophthora cactorum]
MYAPFVSPVTLPFTKTDTKTKSPLDWIGSADGEPRAAASEASTRCVGGRHRPSKRPDDVPPISSNNSSISLQHSSIQRSLLASLHCPAQRVLALGDGPEAPINGQTTGYMPSGPIFQVAYAHTKNLLVAVDEEGVVGVVNVAAGRRKSRWMAHHNAVFDVIWTQDDTQVLTAAGDLEIRIWDVETTGTNSATPVSTLRGHDMSVKCVRQAPDNAHVFASGGRDGRVLLWDTRATGKPVSSLENVHAEPTPSRISSPNVSFTTPTQKRRRRGAAASSSSPSPRSVTCVEFSSSGSEIITAGAVDAVVKFWDLRRLSRGKKKAGAKMPVPIREISCSSREGARRGISSLTLRQRGSGGASHLLVNVLSDSIAVIDIGQKQHQARTVLRCSGHQASSFYCKAAFSPEGDFIAGSSADDLVYVWDARVSSSYDGTLSSGLGVQQRAPCFALKGHTNEVNGVAWSSQDFTQLASCSDDGTVRCWQVGGEKDQRLGRQNQENSGEGARFELQIASCDDSSAGKRNGRTGTSLLINQTGMRTVYEPRLHPVHEIPAPAQQQPQQEPQDSQDGQGSRPEPKRRIKLRRKAKRPVQPKRAQRTLLELWGRVPT